MHNLALALKAAGHQVSGSDDAIFEPSKSRLEAAGLLPSSTGWDPGRIHGDLDAVILGMHAREDNPELAKAQELGLPVYSFPEYIRMHSAHKQRIVIAGSHGKTTITSMVMHVLKGLNKDFDYVVGAQVDGFDTMVRLSDAPVIVIEGDEYLSSALDRRPKFINYEHHIGVVSGIAWDHANVFPTLDDYVQQFELFADATPKAGTLIYCEDDDITTVICRKERFDVNRDEYSTHPHKVKDDGTYLKTDEGKVKVQVFGKHNMQNIAAALAVCKRIGILEKEFYSQISSFRGAARRLELVAENEESKIYRDYAHSPSKVKASTTAFAEQFGGDKMVACLELHTYSSLNKNFIEQYRGAMDSPGTAIVYYNPEVVGAKQLEAISEEDIRQAFDRKDLQVFTDSAQLVEHLKSLPWSGKSLLMMSSGNFDGIDAKSLAGELIG